MIKTHSDDPDVGAAAQQALAIVKDVLSKLPKADSFDYGGHDLHVGEYEVCETCTKPIAEAQQLVEALQKAADDTEDSVVKEHLTLAAHLFELEAEAAIVRAEFHNGVDTEPILNTLLAFQFERAIHDDYQHSHAKGQTS